MIMMLFNIVLDLSQNLSKPQLPPGDYQTLDLTGALIYLCDLGIPEVTLHRQLLAIAHATVNLYCGMSNEHRRFRREQLCHGSFSCKTLTCLLGVFLCQSRVIPQHPGG